MSVGENGFSSLVVVDVMEFLCTIHGCLRVVYLLVNIIVLSVKLAELTALRLGDCVCSGCSHGTRSLVC